MTHVAYLDESQRGKDFYAVAAAVIPIAEVARARRIVQSVAVRGGRRRRHFVKEEDRDRKQMLAAFRGLPGGAVVCISTTHRSTVRARASVLNAVTAHLLSNGVARIVLDHVDPVQQQRDRQVLARVLEGRDVAYGFEPPHSSEPMLWVPDAVAWCAGRGSWRAELAGWVTTITVP